MIKTQNNFPINMNLNLNLQNQKYIRVYLL